MVELGRLADLVRCSESLMDDVPDSFPSRAGVSYLVEAGPRRTESTLSHWASDTKASSRHLFLLLESIS